MFVVASKVAPVESVSVLPRRSNSTTVARAVSIYKPARSIVGLAEKSVHLEPSA